MIEQLTRVNDPDENVTWVYSYDRGGNILEKKKYAYTTGDLTGLTPIQSIPYGYDSVWKDLLVSYNGQTLVHDSIGDLVSDGEWNYTWQAGRQLREMSKTGTVIRFEYVQMSRTFLHDLVSSS